MIRALLLILVFVVPVTSSADGGKGYVSLDIPQEMASQSSSEVKGVSKLSLTDKQQATFPLPTLPQLSEALLGSETKTLEQQNQIALSIQSEAAMAAKRHTGLAF